MLNIHDLKELMLQYTEPLLRLAYYYVKDLQAAEDIVQEVFIKFYHNKNYYEDRGELKAYLTKMTVNKSKDYLKSWAYRKVQLQNKLFPPAGKRNADELVRKDEQAIIGEAIIELPLKQREVLIYFYFNEMTITEVAHILSIPESTVKTRLRRGKELLRNQLKGIEWEVLLNE
ncbi:sigma-70 family RNA polymerase sigma factor [Psychrobacillus sp. NPDC096623]|uniref:sigma-70 family RNA polymerase sigma factor n=1 Tax=Psychrobacillus sp. NPDC096623 TaxID=3364492 RepID=UPI00381D07C7